MTLFPDLPHRSADRGKIELPLELATRAAHQIVAQLNPLCIRLEVAGSLRREQPTIGDIELVAIERHSGMLLMYLHEIGYSIRQAGKRYIKFALPLSEDQTINVDLFISAPNYFGWTYFIRTGCHEWNIVIMDKLNRLGYKIHDNTLTKDGRLFQIADEAELFALLEKPFIPPPLRSGQLAKHLFPITN